MAAAEGERPLAQARTAANGARRSSPAGIADALAVCATAAVLRTVGIARLALACAPLEAGRAVAPALAGAEADPGADFAARARAEPGAAFAAVASIALAALCAGAFVDPAFTMAAAAAIDLITGCARPARVARAGLVDRRIGAVKGAVMRGSFALLADPARRAEADTVIAYSVARASAAARAHRAVR